MLDVPYVDPVNMLYNPANTHSVSNDQHVAAPAEVRQDVALPKGNSSIDGVLQRLGGG